MVNFKKKPDNQIRLFFISFTSMILLSGILNQNSKNTLCCRGKLSNTIKFYRLFKNKITIFLFFNIIPFLTISVFLRYRKNLLNGNSKNMDLNKFFKKVELVKHLNDKEIKLLSDKVFVKDISKGANLFLEKENINGIYFIYSGEVELYRIDQYGKKRRLTIFSIHDFLGEGTLIEDSSQPVSARASMDCVILYINKKDVEDLFEQHPPLANKIISNIAKIISRRMHQSNIKIVDVAAQYESGKTRLEHDLLGPKRILLWYSNLPCYR